MSEAKIEACLTTSCIYRRPNKAATVLQALQHALILLHMKSHVQ